MAGESSDAPVETYNVAASCEGERVDSTLALMLSDYSRARIQTMLRDGPILVDGSRVRPAGLRSSCKARRSPSGFGSEM